ncbi:MULTISPECIES: pyridoxamine 5'-phosphate oxidase family protein [unclassified Streptomyces]|uniref:pyridoxamine 5'-phosphate oxidase family protein n=1 Tax=unclassified Streptomyces TaxID=2593676 RepID=UPI0024422088|nr:pyridoxamine 5'-phosphate oxidase family protein [Streptomyces sp. DH41]MDG9724538.1 pyridoxamine 5'-phosphate oxidase family protein [Streptomyces sp. DH41]
MKITAPPREPGRRKQDVLDRLEREEDIWVATADADGLPCMVPLWFVWHGESVWLCTRLTNPTGRNLRDGARARLAFGHTRDVALIDGEVETFGPREAPAAAAEAFLAKTGWDPREDSASYAWFRVRPLAVQAWHEVHELKERHLMRDGVWTV